MLQHGYFIKNEIDWIAGADPWQLSGYKVKHCLNFEVSPDDRITRIDVVVDIEKEQPLLELRIESAAGVIDSIQSPNR